MFLLFIVVLVLLSAVYYDIKGNTKEAVPLWRLFFLLTYMMMLVYIILHTVDHYYGRV